MRWGDRCGSGLGRGRAFHGSPLPFARARPSFGLCVASGAACRRARPRGGPRTKPGPACSPRPGHVRGPPCRWWGCASPVLFGDRLTDRGGLWPGRGPRGWIGAPMGAVPTLRCFYFLTVGRPRTPLWEAGLAVPGGRQGETTERSCSSGERGCPSLLSASLVSRNSGRVSSAWRRGGDRAVEGCRGRRVGIKTSVRRPGRRSL